MEIDEAIKMIENENACVNRADICDRNCYYCDLVKKKEDIVEAQNMAIEALKFQQDHQEELTYQDGFDNGFNKGCEMTEIEYQLKGQKCIERIDGCIEDTYYKSVSGSISDGNKNAAYHNCKNIIKEEMGVVE